ncbi:MAG: hypothetical protein U0521_14350 [Anaerolineae bacterium]
MAVYQIKPVRETLHGYFSRNLPPVLKIQSGDTVQFQTLECNWHQYDGAPLLTYPPLFEPSAPAERERHALCGPVYIEGRAAGHDA